MNIRTVAALDTLRVLAQVVLEVRERELSRLEHLPMDAL